MQAWHSRTWMMLVGLIVILVPVLSFAQNKYVGVKACVMCHQTEKQGKQKDIWQKSAHANAYKTLTTAKSNEIAKSKGITKPAAEAKECLECHAVVADAKLLDKGFDVKDGVQCESCHGAGSAYRNMTIMKSREKSVAAGMREFKNEADIETYCKSCHNEKSPTFKGFKFKESWEKIKHPVPKAG
jgi:uncharacterized protein YktA (UPF0223 family)